MDDPVAGADEVVVRIEAAGICRSDVHYRAGTRPVPSLPLTPGHEIAGTVTALGSAVTTVAVGQRVAIHYQVSCASCSACRRGLEQFCERGAMLGLARDGGFAEAIAVPARNAFVLPDSIPTEVGAIMMCSTATALHALRRGRLRPGETVAVFGVGGLGVSAIKLALALGASSVFAVDIDEDKLRLADRLGATAVPFDDRASFSADVALELVGSAETMMASVACLRTRGRAVAVGITDETFPVHSFEDLVLREAEVVGAADHTAAEIEDLIAMVERGSLDLSDVVTATVPLDAAAVNEALDRLEAFAGGVRTVITP